MKTEEGQVAKKNRRQEENGGSREDWRKEWKKK